MNQTLLETKALTISVGEKVLLKEINLSFFKTGLVAVLGENGAGKSTLLKEIYHHSLSSDKWHWNQGKRKITYLGHELGFYSSLNLEENLDYFSRLDGMLPDLQKRKQLLELFRLQKRIWDPIHTFSRGMKQKVAILRSLLSSAEVILFDEPYTGLDADSSKVLSEILNEVSKTKLILIVLHSIPKELQCSSQIQIEKGAVFVTHLT
ncbi:ATP-binding cassette domain-containing protein [Leptospira sp. 2 VSF19]|uniref:ATP-binding cassette domain-containing protein n=1 Tax=Leptospira soteropolitanensis TaxID=2950025 RepID=A0AAW5VMJ4_9LEPT|nr:ATP-binding cassette domain-containing protein [Leptospira soteropolitanensis]MCW7493263.1 ATP-binding cassette domain-containing protein [Leptospira soteropolitanensis]MCW7500668.1 ATP-binding cassette domain-containing protein [Leptospira soteropolitanensis]MCW7523113.1 ATP-binding cassette domain-containing protein [Leptospira soteropolitanensis]MCW7526780.1 ATP-binding cassette domain-containing protein [Leptospira soteropolitanensis]MCW7530831.1 ATP-binding cassette domain-containing p